MSELKPYSNYRDSGVAWLGKVPSHWSIEPIGKLFFERRDTVSDADYQPLSVTRNGVVPQLENVAKTSDGESRKLVKAGDFAINSRSDRKGSAGLVDRDGSVSVITTVITPRQMDPQFVHHLLRSVPFQEEYYRYGSGIVADLWSTRWSAMKGIRTVVPESAEQRLIADFLDRETAEIDAFIADQEELIGLLAERRAATISHAVTEGLDPTVRMKDSGIEWVDSIPAHWKSTRLKGLGTLRYGIGEPPNYVDEGVPLIRATNVSEGRITPNRMAYVNPDDIPSGRIVWLQNGDIIVVRSGALTGDSAIIPAEYVGAIAGFDMMFRTGSDAIAMFIQYALLASYVKKAQLEVASTRAAQPHLNAQELGETRIVLAPIDEQVLIVEWLNYETGELDAAIEDAEEAIMLSRERRAALISAAVTGKIDVRERGVA